MTNATDTTCDLYYYYAAGFLRFAPQTKAGETAWREMAAKSHGTAAFLPNHEKSILRQLRKAGYKVAKKQPPGKMSAKVIEDLLKQLEA